MTLEGIPWFCGADVLRVLYGVTSGMGHTYNPLSEDEQRKVKRSHFGDMPGKPMVAISESGLYKLIMRSDEPQARPFQDWVTREVLPSIRKTGAYALAEGEKMPLPAGFSAELERGLANMSPPRPKQWRNKKDISKTLQIHMFRCHLGAHGWQISRNDNGFT